MNLEGSPAPVDANEEIPALIETLLATEQRLEELTAGEVDTVASRDGRTFLLRRAQEQWRFNEAGKQAAILNALPTHIALLDGQGIIISVNEAWRQFAIANVFHAPGQGIGSNYLDVCDRARGAFSSEAHHVAASIRAVLSGVQNSFSIEYPCHSPTEQRWFLLTVTPLAKDRQNGAVVMHLNITERKQAETALRESQSRLEEAQRIARVGSWEWEAATDMSDWSKELCAILGIDHAGPLPTRANYDRLYTAESVAVMNPAVAKAMQDGTPYSIEMERKRPYGSGKWLLTRGERWFDAQGRLKGLRGTMLDITERKRSEKALRASEARFRFLNDLTEATRTLVDPEQIMAAVSRMLGEHLRASRCAYADVEDNGEQFTILHDFTDGCASTVGQYQLSLFGARAVATLHGGETLVVRNVDAELSSGEGADMFEAIGIQAIISCPLVKGDQLRAIMAVHQTTPRNWRAAEIALVQEVVERCWATIERRRTEEALRTNEAEFRALAEAMPQMVWITRPDGWNVYVSKQWMDYTGLTLEESLGHGWNKPFHPEDQQRAWDAWQHATATMGTYSIECRLRREDGIYRWWLIRGVPQQDAGGKILKWFGTCTDIEDLKRAELEITFTNVTLQRQQAELRALFDLMPAMIVFKDTGNIFRRVNQRFADTLGKSVHQIEGRPSIDVFPQDAGRLDADDRKVIQSGAPKLGIIESNRDERGDQRWRQTDKVPVRDQEGKVVGLIVMAQDITERKRTEETVQRLAAIVESSADAIISNTLDGLITSWNPAAEKMFGYAATEIIGQPVQVLVPPDHSHERAEALAGFARGEVVRQYETVRVRKDGQRFDVSATISPIIDPQGNVIGASKIVRDITARKHADRQALFNEQRYRSLVEATTAIVWETPASGEFEAEQPGWSAFTGQTFEELRGWGWLKAIHPEDQEETARVWSAAIASRSIYVVEHRLRRRDRTYRDMMVRAVPILAADGTIAQWIGVHTDITERKKLEAQFLRVQRMESIGTLAGGIAHDLNNILAPILMSIRPLQREITSEGGREMLAIVQSCSQRGADLVRQVLSFARGIEGERILISPVHLMNDIRQIIDQTFPKHIDFNFRPAGDLAVVTGDATQIHQVFMNLCVNARDAMPDGGSLTVTMKNVVVDEVYAGMNPEAKVGTHVLIEVSDTGTGILPTIRERIFEPFFTTKEFGKGTGLGLSTTLAIVRSHGGFIEVTSEPGQGTQFKVYLPANTPAGAADRVVAPAELPRGQGELILVVDDEENIRAIAQRTLEEAGYRVVLAANGAEAVARYAAQRDTIAVVLTDMAMPVMDGPSAIVALKSLNPRVKIIGSSGVTAHGGEINAARSSVQHFIPKPYTAEKLLTVLAQILRETV